MSRGCLSALCLCAGAQRCGDLQRNRNAPETYSRGPLSEQRLAIGRGNTPTSARRPRWRTRLERGLDCGRDEPRGLRVNDDVPAEQHTADDLPGVRGRVVRGRVVRADGSGGGTGGIGLGHIRDCRRNLRSWPGCWTRRIAAHVDPGQFLSQVPPPQLHLLIRVVEAAHPARLQRRGDPLHVLPPRPRRTTAPHPTAAPARRPGLRRRPLGGLASRQSAGPGDTPDPPFALLHLPNNRGMRGCRRSSPTCGGGKK